MSPKTTNVVRKDEIRERGEVILKFRLKSESILDSR